MPTVNLRQVQFDLPAGWWREPRAGLMLRYLRQRFVLLQMLVAAVLLGAMFALGGALIGLVVKVFLPPASLWPFALAGAIGGFLAGALLGPVRAFQKQGARLKGPGGEHITIRVVRDSPGGGSSPSRRLSALHPPESVIESGTIAVAGAEQPWIVREAPGEVVWNEQTRSHDEIVCAVEYEVRFPPPSRIICHVFGALGDDNASAERRRVYDRIVQSLRARDPDYAGNGDSLQ